jgi:hypothetical protein
MLVLVCGCGNDEHRVPAACLEGPKSLQIALEKAPGEVRLENGTKLSECFNRAANPAEIQQVGAIFIDVAEGLAATSRKQPHSRATTQLGYLIGATRRGAGGTQGIHYETQRRIEQELIGVNTQTPEFVSGEKAGHANG